MPRVIDTDIITEIGAVIHTKQIFSVNNVLDREKIGLIYSLKIA